MPLLNKGQVRAAVQQAIDDPNGKRWTNPNLDILITLVQDTIFQGVLDTFEYLTSQTDLTTPDGSGAVLLSALTQRFYRVQVVTRVSDGLALHPRLLPEKLPQPTYYMAGTKIITDPIVTGASSLSVEYTYLPTRFTDLATDATVLPIEYPEGHEAALIYVSAAFGMTKGDAESMQQIARLADVALDAFVIHAARRYPIGFNSSQIQAVKQNILRNPLLMPYMSSDAQMAK